MTRPSFSCPDCGHSSLQWFGRCPECGTWNSAIEEPGAGELLAVSSLAVPGPLPPRLGTGLTEVDRVLGGGFVSGEVVLLAGEPGIGKSTLVLQLLEGVIAQGRSALLVTGEESLSQVGLRARRLGLTAERFDAAASGSLPAALAAARRDKPDVLVIDSIQTVEDPAVDAPAGSVVQVRDSAAALARFAKESGTVVVMIGHVTKEGSVAGPKTLEHLVDAVVLLDGERTGILRLLRSTKNRFGSCDETGVFVMGERGLEMVPDPSAMLLADRLPGVAGSIVFPGLEGTRPVLVEIQGLVVESELAQARRVSIGVDQRRASLLLGVLEKRADLRLARKDVFLAAAGGLTVREPAADLPLCLALWSAARDQPIDEGVVAVGEVGLGGEVRRVPGVDRRLSEAARLGFRRALVPKGLGRAPSGIEMIAVADVSSAFDFVLPDSARLVAS